MSRSWLARVQRDAYLMSRTAGDVNAAKRGTLGRRLIKRRYHRSVIRVLRRGKLW